MKANYPTDYVTGQLKSTPLEVALYARDSRVAGFLPDAKGWSEIIGRNGRPSSRRLRLYDAAAE
jgi:hypothetical protein